jgi:hypothetical protein
MAVIPREKKRWVIITNQENVRSSTGAVSSHTPYFGYAGGRGESFGAGANLGNSGFGASVLFPPTEATVW